MFKKIGLVNTIFFFILLLSALLAICSITHAKGGGGGGGHASSHSSVGRSSSNITTSKVSVAAARAKTQGTFFTSRNEAVNHFQTNNPTNFKIEPTVRPAYIPTSATIESGKSVNIVYNKQYGGYGYFDPSSSHWNYALQNRILLNIMMRHRGYYVEGDNSFQTPEDEDDQTTVIIAWIIFGVIFLVIIIWLIGLFIKFR